MAVKAFNNVTYKELWDYGLQTLREQRLVLKQIANYETRTGLFQGQTIHRPYINRGKAHRYIRHWDKNPIQATTMTDDKMIVDDEAWVGRYIDDHDKKQAPDSYVTAVNQDSAYVLNKWIDGIGLRTVLDANKILDNTINGGSTAGESVQLSKTNIGDITSVLEANLRANDANFDTEMQIIMPASVSGYVSQYQKTAGFAFADYSLKNGLAGQLGGFQLVLSNNLPVVFELAAAPKAGDTVEFGGVVWTWSATPGTEDKIVVGATIADSVANFNMAIRVVDSEALKDAVADAVITAKVIGGKFCYVTPGNTIVKVNGTALTNGWTMMFAQRKGTIDVIVEETPSTKFVDAIKGKGEITQTTCLFGTKLFAQKRDDLIGMRIKLS